MNFPATFRRSGSWFEPGSIEPNKDYIKQILELSTFLSNAKSLFRRQQERNLVLEATKGLFDGSQTLFINANEEKANHRCSSICKRKWHQKKMVIVGGYDLQNNQLQKKNNIQC
jgi:hypothetical protein